jgi:hypothetical protein
VTNLNVSKNMTFFGTKSTKAMFRAVINGAPHAIHGNISKKLL